MIGEWSAALPTEAMRDLSKSERQTATRAYLDVQLMVHDTADAWFYWSYKTEGGGNWSYRHCYERGLLPQAPPKPPGQK
jgi:glucan 1,3-beta-glucosidase